MNKEMKIGATIVALIEIIVLLFFLVLDSSIATFFLIGFVVVDILVALFYVIMEQLTKK